MAHIYGQSGAEKELLCEMPQGIYKFEDIKISLTKLQDKLNKERTTFFENLPNLISEEKDKLEFFKRRENEIGNSWDERIRQIEKTIGDRKIKIRNEHKIKLLFTLPVNCVDLFIKKNLSKPYAMRRAKKDIEAQGKAIYLLENEPDQLFQREQKRLIDELNQLEALKKSPDYSGAYGELQVLNELKKLHDGFHIFCDVNITLPNYVRYGRERNLKSAQMDFVLVGPTGIFVIEVKNWSSEYLRSHDGISPHEQVDRAGKVLYIYFKKHTFHFKPEITKLLVPIQRNLNYDWNYKSVFIRDLPDLRKFIWNNKTVLSDTKINKVASLLENLI